ncbi:MAG: zinc-ribbon domain-containing protein [Acidiferrobacterales bacterium]
MAALPHDPKQPPPGAVMADPDKLTHINTYGTLPAYYVDRPFTGRDCGAEEIWTAEQQKWWYEEAKGHIYSTAVRCRRCRQQQESQ